MLERPGSYDGEIQSWRTWKVKFITYMKALHVEFGTYLYQAEKKTTSIEDFDVPLTLQQHEVYLMSQLVALMNGQCLELVMSADNGFEAWRRLCEDRNRWTVGTKLMKVEQLLDPPLDNTSALRFRETWQTWERDLRENQSLLKGVLTDEVKITCIRRRAPEELRRYLKLHASAYGNDYYQFRAIVEAYLLIGCSEEMERQTPQAMQLDMMKNMQMMKATSSYPSSIGPSASQVGASHVTRSSRCYQ